MRNIKEKKGITLIALAVTIVVILILAAVTIDAVFSEDGIINKAKEAANAMNNAVANDQASLNNLYNELNDIMNGIGGSGEEGDSNSETNTEPEPPETDKPIGDLVEDGTIKVGDYVAYTPTGEASYPVDGTYSGTGTEQVINKESLNWRVLDITDDGKVRLISANPTEAEVELKGANGYNNAVYLLDELCNTLYKGENATAKSLKIEDIQNKMNLSVWDYNNYSRYGATYNPSNKQYPLIFAQEKDQIVDGRSGSLDLSEQTSIITGTGTASTWTVKCTYWENNMRESNYVEPIYYDLFHTAATDTYWLSSRCVDAVSNDVGFDMRFADFYHVGAIPLFQCNGYENFFYTYRVRPVVSLESNVEIDTSIAGKDGTSSDKAWVIK